MKADKAIATYRRMREQPLWRLLASEKGPTVIALLQSHLYEGERYLPASILHERIGRDLEELRAKGDSFPRTAQAYVADWLQTEYLKDVFLRVLQRKSTNYLQMRLKQSALYPAWNKFKLQPRKAVLHWLYRRW